MSKPTNSKVPNPINPSTLPPRYEIRKLTPHDAPHAAAIVCHSNSFHSTVFPLIYPDMRTRVHDMFAACTYLVDHQVASGMSFGVFDTEYEYKTDEARAAGGKLLWNREENASGEKLLEQMEFPLVSVALSYDAHDKLDNEKMAPLVATLPHYAIIFRVLGEKDTRDPQSWEAKGPREVLFRNATSTRHEYEGKGIMGALARWLMREADREGYRGVQIECLNDAVTHVWSKPEAPFEGGVVSEFSAAEWRDDEGKLSFEPSKQRITKCYVDLKPKA